MIELSIVQRAKRGDTSAFAALVEHYYARCLRFALHMVGNREDAEEAVQDAFVRVHGALPRYDERDRFEPWLFRILANRCRTLLGRELRTARVLVFGEPAQEPSAAPDVEHSMLRQELMDALDQLPTAQREAFLLHHVEGLEYDQISAITGAGVSALKMRVKRATDVLRVKFAEVERA
ncbi:MAG TPA: RNA polymerase sigma factor [Gemmatimonadaceae bacterium]|nr:RNA polymerase sigma factor [Gemmatimonadaceae bacterium]